jgi:hypothetical protein
MDRHSWTLWRCMTQNVMYGKRVSHSQVDAQDMHLQYHIISVWFTVNSMIIQWQWTLLHQGEGLDKAVKEWRHDEGENLPTVNAVETVDECVWGGAQRFHLWQKYCLIWRLCFVLLCFKIAHMTTKMSAPNVEISIPHSIAVEVLPLP